MTRHTRIGLGMSLQESIIAMAEGNPGGIHVMMQMLSEGEAIDPDDFMGGFGAILGLDSFGIYGSQIWLLYKDVCGENLVNTLAVLRAVQLGIYPEDELKTILDEANRGVRRPTLDVDDLLMKVQERLPAFGKTPDNVS